MKKRVLSLALTLCMALALLPFPARAAEIVASGECGAEGGNITWTLDSSGLMMIQGTGDMYDYDTRVEWLDGYYDQIRHVNVGDGVTSIGENAFAYCNNLITVDIPFSVTSIGEYAFYDCANLHTVYIRSSVVSIEDYVFYGCMGLTHVYYGGMDYEWSQIEASAGSGNSLLFEAELFFLQEMGFGGGVDELPPAVKYVPYYCYVIGADVTVYEVTDGRLPKGLTLNQELFGIYGVPMESGTFDFALMGHGNEFEEYYTLTVEDNGNTAVQRPNDYDIIKNVGTKDPYYADRFLKTDYSEETFAINGPYQYFYLLLIDGIQLARGVDYTVEKGSTVITIRSQTFQRVGEGTHTIAAEFHEVDANNRIEVKQVAQNYTLTISRPSSDNNSGSGSDSDTDAASYKITVPKDPNCTVEVLPTMASANSRVTLTVKPHFGYKLVSLTVTGPNGEQIPLTQTGEGKYTFRMPNGNVNISVQVEAEQLVPAEGTPFVDVQESDWFYQSIVTVYEREWMVGTSANTFDPYATTSRGMIVSVIHRIAGQPAVEDNAYFSDVPLNQYYASAAAWAAEQGVVTGYGNGRFGPSDDLTREQIVIILYNYANLTGMDTTARSGLTQFTDLEQLSVGAQEAMSWANSLGLISGKGNGILDPAGSASRAEMAALLVRFAALAETQ